MGIGRNTPPHYHYLGVRDEHIIVVLDGIKVNLRLLTDLVHSMQEADKCQLSKGVELQLQSMAEVDRMEELLKGGMSERKYYNIQLALID